MEPVLQKAYTGLPAMDRFMPEVTVDLMYKLHVRDEAWNTTRLGGHGYGDGLAWAQRLGRRSVIKATEFSLDDGDDVSTIPGSPLNAALLKRC